MSLHARARLARERAGFSVNEAAKEIGCSRTLIISWETDAKSIGGTYLIAASKKYKVDPEWLQMEVDDDGYPWGGPAESGANPLEIELLKAFRGSTPDLRAAILRTAGIAPASTTGIDWEAARRLDAHPDLLRQILGDAPPPSHTTMNAPEKRPAPTARPKRRTGSK